VVRLSDVSEEKQGWNPLVPKGTTSSFGATLNLPNRSRAEAVFGAR